MIYSIIWAIFFVIFLVIEISTFDLVSIWIALGALAGLISSLFGCKFWVQLIVFIIASTIFIIATRPLAKKLQKGIKPTNSELDIGKTATVIEEINNSHGKGRVNLNGVHWAAKSVDGNIIPEGEIVVVKEIDGAKLIVSKEKN